MSNMNLTEKVINYIKENILNGSFPIGSKLPSERTIANQFNISRIPVRQAIQRLCQEGILQSVPASSPIIQGFKSLDLFNDSEPFDNREIQGIYVEALRGRQLIESESARLVATNARPSEIEEIRKAFTYSIAELEKVSNGILNECSDADLNFHKAIIKASHSPLFIKYYELIPKTIFSNQSFGFKYRTSLKDMIEHHRNIMSAIEKGDGNLAYETMYEHLEEVILLFNNKLK